MLARDEFWRVMEAYGTQIRPAQIVFYVAAILIVGWLTLKPGKTQNHFAKLYLSLAFAWSGIAFYFVLASELAGESYGNYQIGNDTAVFDHITSANVACGWHAGDPRVMDRTVAMAVERGVGVGAHPGFPDRVGFGRRAMACTPEEIRTDLIYQIGALQAFCRIHGTRLRHVKPHGALYLAAVADADVARTVAEAIVSIDPDLLYVALAGAKGAVMRRIGLTEHTRFDHPRIPVGDPLRPHVLYHRVNPAPEAH